MPHVFRETEPLDPDSVFTLSYLGDAWYEIWCRQKVLSVVGQSNRVHSFVTELVRCQAQASIAQLILGHLNFEEQQIFRRGKNKKPLSSPKHATVKDYRTATGFECLVGYWFLNGQQDRFYHFMESQDVCNLIDRLLIP